MCWLERERFIFPEQNSANSLHFSLLAGNFGGEWLAPDWSLRQLVLAAEKLRRPFPRNPRKMPICRDHSLGNRTAESDCSAESGGVVPPFLRTANAQSGFKEGVGESNAITRRMLGEWDLTCYSHYRPTTDGESASRLASCHILTSHMTSHII